MADAEYYKTRVTELREDNKALMDTRDALEEQLQRARKRAEQCLSLEAAMIKLKREANDIALVRYLMTPSILTTSLSFTHDIKLALEYMKANYFPGKGC